MCDNLSLPCNYLTVFIKLGSVVIAGIHVGLEAWDRLCSRNHEYFDLGGPYFNLGLQCMGGGSSVLYMYTSVSIGLLFIELDMILYYLRDTCSTRLYMYVVGCLYAAMW